MSRTLEELYALRKKCMDRKGYKERCDEIEKEIARRENGSN